MPKAIDNTPIDLDALDFGGISTEFEPLAIGSYRATFTNLELKMSQANQPYLNVTFDLSDEAGKQFSTFSLQRKAMWRIKQVALRVGCSPERWEQSLSVDDIVEEFMNRDCVIIVDIEEYKPKDFIEGDPIKGKLKKRNKLTEIYGADYVMTQRDDATNPNGKKSRRQF